MTWTDPGGFTWLLAVAAVILIYLFRGRKITQPTGVMFLWRRALAKRSPWRRVRPWLSVAWRSLVVVFLALALAQPYIGPINVTPRTFVFVLDATASMQATDGNPTRFAKAKQEILELLDKLGPYDRAALILAASEPRVLTRFSGDVDGLKSSVEGALATHATGDASRAFAVATEMIRGVEHAEILVFSDKPVSKDSSLQQRILASNTPNVAITSIQTRRRNENETQVLVRVARFGNIPNQVDLVWRWGDRVETHQLVFETGEAINLQTFEGQGLLTVEVRHDDALVMDNRVTLALAPAAESTDQIEIGLTTRDNVPVASTGGTLQGPGGRTREVATEQSLAGPLDFVGEWTWTSKLGDTSQTWHANLLSAEESELPQATTSGSEPLEIAAGALPPEPQFQWFLLAAATVWLTEWLAFLIGITE